MRELCILLVVCRLGCNRVQVAQCEPQKVAHLRLGAAQVEFDGRGARIVEDERRGVGLMVERAAQLGRDVDGGPARDELGAEEGGAGSGR